MSKRVMGQLAAGSAAAAAWLATSIAAQTIPTTWDEIALSTAQLKPPVASAVVKQVSADYYYRIAERVMYRRYPVYSSKTEPPGYLTKLAQAEPEVVFDINRLKTERDWVAAGAEVFRYPISTAPAEQALPYFRAILEQARVPVARDGTYPQLTLVVPKKRVVQVGFLSCATCHTRVQPDGSMIEGAQGTVPDALLGFPPEVQAARAFQRALYRVPWLDKDPIDRVETMSVDEISTLKAAMPLGVVARHGSSLFAPTQIPDLIGIAERKYLDHTGLMRNRDIGDLMRYAALNNGTAPAGLDMLADYSGFVPFVNLGPKPDDRLPPPEAMTRYSDPQLFALAKFLRSLKPPPNPNVPSAVTRQGEKIFVREGCPSCHTPPLYTSNKLTIATGFRPGAEDLVKYDILPISVQTDSDLTLKTRRGTGYYKVPSLKGVWYRSMFGHSGWCATLEDWFDPRRTSEAYVPTGFKPYGAPTYAVKGHPFGLNLSVIDRAALIGFLKSL